MTRNGDTVPEIVFVTVRDGRPCNVYAKRGAAVGVRGSARTIHRYRLDDGPKKKRKRLVHRVGEVWHHEDEATRRLEYQPMRIVQIVGRVFLMSDCERWTASELRASGWSPKKE